jgi:hypothetical protein
MTEHREEGLMDRVKSALGMGGDDDRTTMNDRVDDTDAGSGLDAGAWNEGGPSTGSGGTGPEYDPGTGGLGANVGSGGRQSDGDLATGTEGGIGTSPGFGTGSDERTEDGTTLTGGGTSEWTRGEAASGQSPFGGGGEDEDDLDVAGRDRPIGA